MLRMSQCLPRNTCGYFSADYVVWDMKRIMRMPEAKLWHKVIVIPSMSHLWPNHLCRLFGSAMHLVQSAGQSKDFFLSRGTMKRNFFEKLSWFCSVSRKMSNLIKSCADCIGRIVPIQLNGFINPIISETFYCNNFVFHLEAKLLFPMWYKNHQSIIDLTGIFTRTQVARR